METLDLQLNFLKIHENQFKGLVKLRKLNLCSNNMKRLDKMTFHGLHCLEILNLKNNKLTNLDENIFSELGRQLFFSIFINTMLVFQKYIRSYFK